MELLNKINEHLLESYGNNYIFEFDESEKDEYNLVPNMLEKDYGFVDIILDQNDFNNLLDGYDESKPYEKYACIQDNFQRIILKKLNIEYNDDILTRYSFEGMIKRSTNVERLSRVRLHIMADSITDIYIQMVINDYIVENRFTVFLYKSKELLTYYNGGAVPMLNTHNYYSEASNKFTRKRDLRIERFEKRYD